MDVSRARGGKTPARSEPEGPGVRRRRRTTLYVVTILTALAVGTGVGALLRPRPSHAISARVQRALQNHRNFQGHTGPWGLIEYSRIVVSMPLDYAPGAPETEPTRW